MATMFVLVAVLLLAWSNGANDNFKGVATIYGSGSASYRACLAWATATTFVGSLLALLLAGGLVKTFSAKGLVPDAVATSPAFLAAVASGAMATVLLATRLGMPVSTTHALTGALVGAGLLAVGRGVNFSQLGRGFFLPLLVSPLISIALTLALYPLARWARQRLGVGRESCVCIGGEWVPAGAKVAPAGCCEPVADGSTLGITTGTVAECRERYQGRMLGLSAQSLLDGLHFASAGAVSLARGLNDAPKIFALLLAAKALGASSGLFVVGAAMALGGVINARRVAETMSHKITRLNAGQGFVANLVTAGLVIGASRLGMPVSTTHVATGGLFGIGLINGTARFRTIATILVAWGTTLPLGAGVGAASYALLTALLPRAG